MRTVAALVLTLPLLAACTRGEAAPASEVRRAGLLVDFAQPETVVYDAAQDVYFVSCIVGYGSDRDGNGQIVRVKGSQLGHMETFIQGGQRGATLDAPKGMAIHGDTLWVADIDKMRAFDTRSGAPLATVDLAPLGAVLLNGVAVGGDGSVRATDSGILMTKIGVIYVGGDKIFSIGPGLRPTVVAAGHQLQQPDGIVWDAKHERWLVVGFQRYDGQLYALPPHDTTRTVLVVSPKGNFDGVQVLPDGRILYTSWQDSSIHIVDADGRNERRLVHPTPSPAGIAYDARRGVLAIPMVNPGRVEFVRVGSGE